MKRLQPLPEISRHDQFESENIMWQRFLKFFNQENVALKTRLSLVIDSKDDKNLFNLAEYFQNQFLLKDEEGEKLEEEITNQLARLNVCPHIGYVSPEIQRYQESLRGEITYFESDFLRLKNEFNQLIFQNL